MKVGDKYGNWTIIKDANKTVGYNKYWTCMCVCGNVVDVSRANLRSGRSKGCRKCFTKNSIISKSKRLNIIYSSMFQRCYNSNTKEYKSYGGRSIKICEDWLGERGKINFYNWAINNGYNDNLSIDRIDNDKGYSPDNCRWATREQQANNTSKNVFIEYKGEKHTIAQWAKILNMSQPKLAYRLKHWSIKKAFEK